MTATTLINLIARFELKAISHRTLNSAMIAAFGFDWELVPEYIQVADYASTFMTYHEESGEWY